MQPFEFLGPYRIKETLGRGGMGTVFAAVHEKTGERVAVKLIAQHVADEPRFRRRFDSEVKSLQRLRHRGIVRLIGFGEEDGLLFYSMELVEGESLQQRIRREKKLDWRVTIDIAIQICAALKHAHDIGVIHRDLKPANLILMKDDSVKLVDFGIAKIFGDGEQTQAGSVLGTADYMAPEQATGQGVTQRTDLYALGSVMYTMLTGRPPFTGKKITEVIESLKRDRPVPLDLVNPDLPDALVELVHQLLEKDPDERPPTALAVMNRLKAMRAGLQRQHTVLADNAVTVELADLGNRETSATGDHADSDAATDISGEKAEAEKKKTVVSKRGTRQHSDLDPQLVTVVSGGAGGKTVRPDGSVADDDTEDAKRSKTHFQTVGEGVPTSGLFDHAGEDRISSWRHWLGIAGMLCILLIGTGLFIYAVRPPTADQLYKAAKEAGDAGAMTAFLHRFPEDDRYREVLNLQRASQLGAVLKRLGTQAKLGISPLEASEESFVSAMKDREQQPVQSMERLEHWLNVYDSVANEQDPNLKEMIELARHERSQLAIRAPAIIVDPRAQGLIDDIDKIVANESPETVRRKLTSIVETFGNDLWAQPAVEEAKNQIQLLKPDRDQR